VEKNDKKYDINGKKTIKPTINRKNDKKYNISGYLLYI